MPMSLSDHGLYDASQLKLEDKSVLGSVHAIETFSTADGPGIRLNVFLQGCAKRCVFCCNPETRKVCDPVGNPEFAMTDAQIAAKLEKYKTFLQPNNGGITVSGGEPLMQPSFVAAVYQRAHEMGLTTCLDTACHGSESDWKMVLDHTDYVMLCPKGMDSNVGAWVAGVSPQEIDRSKEFARFVRDNYPNTKLSLRWVLLKNITDTEEELTKLVELAKDLAPVFTHVELIPYHHLGKSKYADLGLDFALGDMPVYNRDDAKAVGDKLRTSGIDTMLAMA